MHGPEEWSSRNSNVADKIRLLNIVMMGALSGLLETDPKIWEEVMQRRVPKRFLDLNREAYRRGRALV